MRGAGAKAVVEARSARRVRGLGIFATVEDGYLTRRRRLVDGVALLVDVGGEAALSVCS